MKFLFDLLPVILFFCVFRWGDAHPGAAHDLVNQYLSGLISGGVVEAAHAPIMLATVVGIVATVLQIVYLLLRGRKVDGMLWLSLVIISVFGGATIYFHNEDFIKWKPTIFYWCFSVALLVSQAVFNKNLMRKALEAQLKLPEPIWRKVNYVWSAFFFLLGLVNLLAAFVLFKADTAGWVSFKLFGISGLFFVFIIGQGVILSKYAQEQA